MKLLIKNKWKSLSIRTQLVILMVLVLSFIQLGTLSLVTWFDSKERQSHALYQAKGLLSSLNQDLLKAIFSSNTDVYADISFRISGYPSVKSLIVIDTEHKPIFSYGSAESTYSKEVQEKLQAGHLVFNSQGNLLFKANIEVDNFVYGSSIIVIDSSKYHTQKWQHIITLLAIFPIELLIGFLLVWKVGRSFTEPFNLLASSMKKNDINKKQYYEVETQEKNEIGDLFNGYNQMIKEIRASTEKMLFISEHDSLTGLLNRYAIENIITALLQNSKNKSNVLFSVDLDQFKLINDSVGHAAGDELLKMISHSCSQKIPETASLARVGGDDFFVVLENITEEEGVTLANEILKNLKDFRFFWEGEAISVSGTIGLVAFKPFEYTLGDLVKAADAAFYTAKASGRNKLHVYHPGDEQAQQYSTEIKVGGFIKEALKEGPSRFELYAQDIVPLQRKTDKVSYEILIRMFDNKGQFLAPDNFLPTAERYQMMVDIDIYVLTQYLKIVTRHPKHLQQLESVHINLAGGTLNNPEFQSTLKQLIVDVDFPWHKLELEVTETSAVGNLNQAESFINYCKKQKIGFALDDFGTGMASFEYLKNLPFDVIKIDGSFIRDMHTDPVDHAMIRYTHDISRLKGQKTVAEYVETQADVDELTRIGITYGQGYFLGKPRPLVDWF